MSIKNLIINKIIGYYINSTNFNGMPLIKLQQQLKENIGQFNQGLTDLVKLGFIALNYTNNPYIKQFKDFPVSEQLEQLNYGDPRYICVFPTEKSLRTRLFTEKYDDRPFTRMLFYGKPQLQAVYIDLCILDDYFADQNYDIRFNDYSGSISYRGGQVLLSTFGLGYKAKNRERVVAVFLKYISALPSEHQQRWSMRLVKEKCHTVKKYEQDIILADWIEYSSKKYDAFTENFVALIKRRRKNWQQKVNFRMLKRTTISQLNTINYWKEIKNMPEN